MDPIGEARLLREVEPEGPRPVVAAALRGSPGARIAPGPITAGGAMLVGVMNDAGLIADIQIRVLYVLNRSVTRELKLMYESA